MILAIAANDDRQVPGSQEFGGEDLSIGDEDNTAWDSIVPVIEGRMTDQLNPKPRNSNWEYTNRRYKRVSAPIATQNFLPERGRYHEHQEDEGGAGVDSGQVQAVATRRDHRRALTEDAGEHKNVKRKAQNASRNQKTNRKKARLNNEGSYLAMRQQGLQIIAGVEAIAKHDDGTAGAVPWEHRARLGQTSGNSGDRVT